MRVVAIAGFLGSGKTSLLLLLATALAAAGRRAAVIENDVGPVGVDGARLTRAGLRVREIAAGCVCCGLRGDLLSTLQALWASEAPEVVFVEPSGVAAPGHLRDIFAGASGVADCLTLVLADGARWDLLLRKARFFLTGSLRAADRILLTKIDALPPAEQARVASAIRGLCPGAPLHAVSSESGAGLDELLALLEVPPDGGAGGHPRRAPASGPAPRGTEEAAGSPFPNGVYADTSVLAWDPPRPPAAVAAWLRAHLESTTRAIREGFGADTPGHAKAVIETEAGMLFANATRFDQPATIQGALVGPVASGRVKRNLIVHGPTSDQLRACLAAHPTDEADARHAPPGPEADDPRRI